MPSIAENCLKFRKETLAPSGGWLASLAIGISLSTGIFEYTILAIVWTVSFIIIRTASCESAMVLALAYDLIIPFQYQNVGRHQAELDKYWPKFMIGCMIEGLCYILLHPDLFNFAVVAKTTIMLTIWMSGKKQYPLNLHKDTPAPASAPARESSRRPREAAGVTPAPSSTDEPSKEYLAFVNDALKKLTGDLKVDDKKRRGIVAALGRPDKRKQAEESLTKRKIPTYEQWKKSKGGGGSAQPRAAAPGPTAPAAPTEPTAPAGPKTDRLGEDQVARLNDQMKKVDGLDDALRQKYMKRLQKPFADPDWEAARQELSKSGVQIPSAEAFQAGLTAGSGSSKQPAALPPKHPNWNLSQADLEQVQKDGKKKGLPDWQESAEIFHHGPTHPMFHSVLNHYRGNGIDTRKWVPRKPSSKKVYVIPQEIQDKAMPIIQAKLGRNREAFSAAKTRLTREAQTMKDFEATIKKLNAGCPGLDLKVEKPYEMEATPWGQPMSTYYHGLRLARDAGGDKEADFEALYDWLSDPANRKDPRKPNKKKDERWDAKEKLYSFEYGSGKAAHLQDRSGGRAGFPTDVLHGYRVYLDDDGAQGGGYAENVKDAILLDIKNAATKAEGEAIWNRVKSAKTTPQRLAIMKEFGEKTPEQLAWNAMNEQEEARAAAERQMEAGRGRT